MLHTASLSSRCARLGLTALLAAGLLACLPAAAQVGLQRSHWAGADAAVPEGVIWYPSPAPATQQRFGPFEVAAAPGAPAAPGKHALVVISHGTGGHEMGHAWLSQMLAAEGFIVLSVRHPGDNFQDRSGVSRPDYLAERPRQLSRALDALLADPQWAPLVDTQRIFAVGHSAGGHTVLALAGGRPDRVRLVRHCSASGTGLQADAAMCRLAGFSAAQPAPTLPADTPALPAARDARIRAVVAVSPLGQGLNLDTLAADVEVPVMVEASRKDEVLAYAFHGGALCVAMPRAACAADEHAGHFAVFQAGTGPMGAPGLDPAWNPAGFDRSAWQAQAGPRILAFLKAQLR